ncbi:MAG: tripartite tricarboxylate transporter TctB family protein [Ahrensia sp.]|nr:tripartite tricarboxylate transporter TctB family protein [Ahrensia sp.]
MASDRIFGLVATLLALAYVASATQIQTSFMQDPVGPKAFPILIGCVAAICGLWMVVRPDPEPTWPAAKTFGALGLATIIMIFYAYALKPLGFLLPTAITAGVLSYQIAPYVRSAVLAGIGLSAGLFILFKYALGLGLFALPRWLM